MIFADARLGSSRLYALSDYDHVFPFKTEGLVYSAISGHPDIFISPLKNKIVIAPNLTPKIKESLNSFSAFPVLEGTKPVERTYPHSVAYNLAFSSFCSVGKLSCLDPILLSQATQQSQSILSVPQGYTRCNLLWLPSLHNSSFPPIFVTSDKGIEKTLLNKKFEGIYIDPTPILLPGFPNGFIGGCAGIKQNYLFFTGALSYLKSQEEKALRELSLRLGYQIVELSNGPLIDGGSLLYIPDLIPYQGV